MELELYPVVAFGIVVLNFGFSYQRSIQLLSYLMCGPTDARTTTYLSPVLLQTWLEDSISILGYLSLEYQSLGRTKQDRTSCNIGVVSKVPPHSCYFMPIVLAWLETQNIKKSNL
jgi:hypothetical protein